MNNELEIYQKLTKRAEEVALKWTKAYTGSLFGVYATDVKIDVARKVITFTYRYVDGVSLNNPHIELDIKHLEDDSEVEALAHQRKGMDNRKSTAQYNRITELENTEIYKEWAKLKQDQNWFGFSPLNGSLQIIT